MNFGDKEGQNFYRDKSRDKREERMVSNRKRNLLVGIGNTLLEDEGVGVWLARYLRNKLPGFDVLEVSHPNFGLLHELNDRDLVLFIDALSPESPEEYVFFEIHPQRPLLKLSLHEISIEEFLHFSLLAGVKWRKCFVFGIRAPNISFHAGPSKAVRKRFGYFQKKLIEHLAEAGAY